MIVIEKKQQLVVIRNIIGCITSIGLNLLLIPLWGVKGAVITSVITAFCTGFVSHIFIPRYHPILRMKVVCILIGWKDLLAIPLKRIKIISSK